MLIQSKLCTWFKKKEKHKRHEAPWRSSHHTLFSILIICGHKLLASASNFQGTGLMFGLIMMSRVISFYRPHFISLCRLTNFTVSQFRNYQPHFYSYFIIILYINPAWLLTVLFLSNIFLRLVIREIKPEVLKYLQPFVPRATAAREATEAWSFFLLM